MSNRFINPFPQFSDSAGKPLAGGSVGFYITGTSTLAAIFTDAANTIPAANPIGLDARGTAATSVFLSPSITYKMILYSDAAATIPVGPAADPLVDPAANVTAAIQVYAGNPNGNVAGSSGSIGGSSASMIYDITDQLLFVCTTSGNASAAIWTQVASRLSGQIIESGVASPTALIADQNNYNPAGFSSCSRLRQDSTTEVNITGLVPTSDGQHVTYQNISAFYHVLNNANASSVPANRFAFDADIVLAPGQSVLLFYDGVLLRWKAKGASPQVPTGTVLEYYGTTAPVGFLFANAQAVSRTLYAGLFSIIGTSCGVGDGSTTFNVPDKRGIIAVGADNMGGASAANKLQVTVNITTVNTSTAATVASVAGLCKGMVIIAAGVTAGTTIANIVGTAVTLSAVATASATVSGRFSMFSDANVIGAVGGEAAHQLNVAELASHAHNGGVNSNSSGGGQGNIWQASGSSLNTQAAGSDVVHNNIQPSIVCNFIIKT